MTSDQTCSRCGCALSTSGSCPRCLVRLGIDLVPRDPDAGRTSTTSAPSSTPTERREPPPLEEIAARFPGLEILGLLGRGGMGVVYRARQRDLDREIALKILAPELCGTPSFVERFLREARALARLTHPNIVTVYDYGQDGDLCWLLMEYVDGTNLRDLLRRGALPPERALSLVGPMCDALQCAHDQGIVHRDVKPENILLDTRGVVKVVDFGLAKLAGDKSAANLTNTQQVMGTPQYMAPEQMRASHDVDHRADIYSLGVVIYELLTGGLPVGNFALPSRRVAVDVRIDDVVLRAMEHAPERRYQQAAEVKSDVAAAREPDAAPRSSRRREAPIADAPGSHLTAALGAATAVIGAFGMAAAIVATKVHGDDPQERNGWYGVSVVALGCALLLGAMVRRRWLARLGRVPQLDDPELAEVDGMLAATGIVALLCHFSAGFSPQNRFGTEVLWVAGAMLGIWTAGIGLRRWFLRRKRGSQAAKARK